MSDIIILKADSHLSPLTPTHHAMVHAISTYLTYLKQQLTIVIGEENESQVSGIHAAQSSLRSLHDLAVLLCDIICWVSLLIMSKLG